MVKAKGRETGSEKKLMTRASGEVAEMAENVRFSYSTEDQPLVQRALIQVQHRSTILQKMLDKELREQRLAVERRADREVEEVINSRLSR